MAGITPTRVLIGATALALALAACSSSSSDSESKPSGTAPAVGGLKVEVVSTRPDMVTGGDALIDIAGGSGAVNAKVNGKDLETKALGTSWLVKGIPDGKSTITVARGSETGTVDVEAYPITGPVFSGPHLPLLECSTQDFDLGPATDDNCSAASKTDYLYGTASGQLRALADPAEPPGDVAQVKVGDNTAPFVVQRERGVINRSVYTIDTPMGDAWNKRLVYRYGGGCGTSFGQGSSMTSADAAGFLAEGYAVATATFNTFQTQCNDVLSAETTMMVKEHFIETFGVPVHTIGEGASGGAIQQHLIIQNYPGLLDASIAILPFPDAASIAPGVTDCGLLNRYYKGDGSVLSTEQRTAINGHATPATCTLWENSFLEGIRPSDGCAPSIPKAKIYDAKTNPKGLRCDLADANINQFGIDPETGFANRALDNAGVQYGLQALKDKVITVDQFLDLNENVGGFDVDGNMVAEREVANEESLKRAYGKGRVSVGGGDQEVIPLINLNIYNDTVGDIHDRFRVFMLRERLGSDNFVIWTRGGVANGIGDVLGNIVSGGNGAGDSAIAVLDRWLDTGKIPDEAVDNCLGADGAVISGEGIYEEGPCADNFPLHGDPRTAAGAPLRNDILKCQLTDVDVATYGGVTFDDSHEARLRRIFPDGVCDWTKTGVGQVPLEGTWLRY